jgi:putative PEP-CTERM system TPR-repeat lipoprotein
MKNLIRTILFSLLIPAQSVVNAQPLSERLEKASSAVDQQQYSAALIHLKNAVKDHPENLQAKLKLAELLILIGQGDLAEIELDKAIRLGATPRDTEVLMAKSKLLQGQFDFVTEQIRILDLSQADIARMRALQGHAYFEQRKFDLARQMFLRAASLDKDVIEVQLGQAKLHRLLGETGQELQVIESLLQRHPQNPEVLVVASETYRNQDDHAKALELLENAGKIQPSNVNVWYGKVKTYIAQNRYDLATGEIDKVLATYPEHQVGNYLMATIAYQKNEFQRAKAALQVVLKGPKRQSEALQLLATVLFELKEYDEAEDTIKKFLKIHPSDFQGRKTQAAIYLRLGQYSKALEVLHQLEQREDPYIYSMLATAYISMGNNEKADRYVSKSLQLAPNNLAIKRHIQQTRLAAGETIDIEFTDSEFSDYYQRGHLPVLNLLRKRDYAEAIRILKGYLGKMPGSPLMHYLLGSAYLYNKDIKPARDNFAKAIELDKNHVDARILLSKIYQLEDDEREAEKLLRDVLKIDANNDQAMVALAGIFQRAGNEEEMMKWLLLSRKMNPSSLASREVLERIYREKGDMGNALQVSEEMVAIQPQNARLLERLAINQKQKGMNSHAIQTFQKIVDLNPNSVQAHFRLGQLNFLSQRYNGARESFQKVVEMLPQNLEARVALIETELKLKNSDEAMRHAKLLQQQHPKHSAAYDLLGDVSIDKADYRAAITHYKKSLSIQPRTETYLKLFSAYNMNGQLDVGIKELKGWIAEYPNDLNLKEALAITLQRSKDFKAAGDLYQEIIDKGRANDRILNNFALVSLQLGNPMSMEYADMAFNLRPEDPSNMDTRGWVMLGNNNLGKGFELLKQAVEKDPNNPKYRYHLAVALSKLGEKSEALKHLYLATSGADYFDGREDAVALLESLKSKQ